LHTDSLRHASKLKELESSLAEAEKASAEKVAQAADAKGELDDKAATAKLSKQLRAAQRRAQEAEEQLVQTKMQWANLDMENEELAMKL